VEGTSGGDGSHDVGDHESRLAVPALRYLVPAGERAAGRSLGLHQVTLVQQVGHPAVAQMAGDDRIACRDGEVTDRRVPVLDGGPSADADAVLVVGVQHQVPALAQLLGDQGLDADQLLDRVDPVGADMVARDVGDHGDIGPVVAQPAPHEPAAGSLQYGCLHGGVAQQHVRGPRAGGVGDVDQIVIDVHALGRGHAGPAVPAGAAGARSAGPYSSCRWYR